MATVIEGLIEPQPPGDIVAAPPQPAALPSAFDAYRAVRYFASLDGLRAASIVAVIWHHTTTIAGPLPMSSRGFLGVDMFFVVSGFLIVTLLLRERDTRGDIALDRFYARRSLRIFPIYYTLLAVLAVFCFVRPEASLAQGFFAHLPWYLTYTSNWLPDATILAILWSLATEEQFYLVWPPIEKFVKRNGAVLVLAFFLGVNQMVNFGLLDSELAAVIGFTRADLDILQITFTPICLGVLLAHVLNSATGYAAVARWLGRRWSPLAAVALLLGAMNIPGDVAGWPRLAIQLAMTLLLATCVVREDHALRPLLAWGPIRRLGVISYGLYLYHMFARHAGVALTDRLDLAGPLDLFVATLLVSAIIAELSYRYFETPFLKLKGCFAATPVAARSE